MITVIKISLFFMSFDFENHHLQLKIVKKMSKEDKKAGGSIFYIIFDLRPLLFN